MTRFSDAALLKGDYAKMLKDPPAEADWKKAACDNGAEEAAQAIAKQIFGFQKSIDQEKEKLEVVTYSSLGPIKVLGVAPVDGDMMRIDGVNPSSGVPVSIVQHITQLSLTFTKATLEADKQDKDDGIQIGYVIFDELSERKKSRDAAKRKKPKRKAAPKKALN